MKTNVLWVAALGFAAVVTLTGCPPQGVVCKEPTVACGVGCVDPTFDRRNCGGCGLTCQPGQVCNAGVCECGERDNCAGRCVVLETDPANCGACGRACTGLEVCQAAAGGDGGCQSGCTAPFVQCGLSCVDLGTSAEHCGACGTLCEDNTTCRNGKCTYDLVLACRNFGFLKGIRSTAGGIAQGPLVAFGTTPNSLASHADVLLVTDDTDRRLLQASLQTLQRLKRADGGDLSLPIGNVPNQVYVSEPYAYVANAFSNTLQIIELESDSVFADAGTADAGTGDGGFDGGFDGGLDGGDGGTQPPPPQPIHDEGTHPFGLSSRTVAEVNFGANTNPNGVVVLGQYAYVPLYGGFAAGAAAGQKLAKVDINDAGIVGMFDLTTLPLGSFDGGVVLPRPYSVAAFGGKIYVTLNNFDADYVPAAPGMIAEYDPATGGLVGIGLGADKCLNPVSFAQTSDTLFVSCNGKSTYDATFVLQSVENNGVLALGRSSPTGPLTVKASWRPFCPPNVSCKPASVGRIAVTGNRVFVADQGEGRVWVLNYDGATALNELSALSFALQTACPPTDATHPFSNVADIFAPQ